MLKTESIARAALAVIATGGCVRPTPAPAETTVNEAPQTEATRAPIDPRSCIAPPSPEEVARESWNTAVAAQIDELSPKLVECSPRGIAGEERAEIKLLFDERGSVRALHLERATFSDCAAAACMKRILATLRVPAPPPSQSGDFLTIGVAPGSSPRRIEPVGYHKGDPVPPRGACADPPSEEAITGRLPPEVIQSTVRASFDELRQCYEAGLSRDRQLQGRIAARFMIGGDGKTTGTRIFENTIPDCEVVRCLERGFAGLKFPEPKGGIVTVVYPIEFRASDHQ